MLNFLEFPPNTKEFNFPIYNEHGTSFDSSYSLVRHIAFWAYHYKKLPKIDVMDPLFHSLVFQAAFKLWEDKSSIVLGPKGLSGEIFAIFTEIRRGGWLDMAEPHYRHNDEGKPIMEKKFYTPIPHHIGLMSYEFMGFDETNPTHAGRYRLYKYKACEYFWFHYEEVTASARIS